MGKGNDARGGLSKKEWEKKYGKKWEDDDDDDNGDKSYQDIVDSILDNTPAQQDVLPSFEDVYSGNILDKAGIEEIKKLRPDVVKAFGNDEEKIQKWWQDYGKEEMPELVGRLEAEDYEQAEALYTPYFENLIANDLEDLNAWSESESVSYDRSLRRARFSLAAGGGAIGTEREQVEGEITTDHDSRVSNAVRATERQVGTENVKNAGYESAGREQEGALVGGMKESIQEGQLWYKNQRAQRYYGNANTYYQQPSAYSLSGNKL